MSLGLWGYHIGHDSSMRAQESSRTTRLCSSARRVYEALLAAAQVKGRGGGRKEAPQATGQLSPFHSSDQPQAVIT